MNGKLAVLGWLLLSITTAAQGRSLTSKFAFPCRSDPTAPEEILVEVLGTMSLQLGTDDAAGNAMNCLLQLWPTADGALAEALPNAFVMVMEENPDVFFSAMSKNPTIFRGWLDELPECFTWFKDPPCLLEPRRKQLISLLKNTDLQQSKLDLLKRQVVSRLSSIRCRQIN